MAVSVWWAEAQFKHEKGAEYVARFLAERGPFHALDLASKTGGGVSWRDGFEKLMQPLSGLLEHGGGRTQGSSLAPGSSQPLG